MKENNWSLGFYREFAVDFDLDGWTEFDENILEGLDETRGYRITFISIKA